MKTMTLNLPQSEMDCLEKLAKEKDMSKNAVMRQALRLYQMIDRRQKTGEEFYFENESTREKAALLIL